MNRVFDEFSSRLKGQPIVLWITMLAMTMFVIGAAHFIEDAISSHNGIITLEEVFDINPVNLKFVYWTLALTPQIGQTVLSYMWLTDRSKNRWALWVALGFFVIDFVFDLQDRSNNHFLPLEREVLANGVLGPAINIDAQTMVAAMFTLLAFTVGSELFITVSIGLFLTLVKDAIGQAAKLYAEVLIELAEAREKIAKAHKVGMGHMNNQRQPQPQGGGGGNRQPNNQPRGGAPQPKPDRGRPDPSPGDGRGYGKLGTPKRDESAGQGGKRTPVMPDDLRRTHGDPRQSLPIPTAMRAAASHDLDWIDEMQEA